MHPMRFLGVAAVLGLLTNAAAAETGRAVIRGTEPGSKLAGEMKLEETDAGLRIDVTLSGAPPGDHGFHVHQFGSCDDGGKISCRFEIKCLASLTLRCIKWLSLR